ncbi:tyrosine protein kinase [Gordonia iterans]|uniref:non-specific serine/threonine protein kinase n=1 Tax=Gordonia iterans TaxID=1004901 RepID=A0A2S0KJ92_9ACTN|nr:protein kinase [Gordonia iterans]AVM01758.1 tyrosine protein kinase [Gordonia iterans]
MTPSDHPQLLADFVVVRRLGDAGNGTFYLAVPPQRLGLADDRVVVKVFSGPCSDDAYRRGVRELRAFAAVRSPYLAKLYDAVLQGQFMYAMEYFPAGSLADPAGGVLERDAALAALADAARGVHDLHEAGIAHGNVTPSSVMIFEGGGRICDLGLSRVLSTDEPLTSFVQPGSVQYVDPSLLAGGTPSRATDVWSLGACLHFVLTGTGVYGAIPEAQPMLAIRAALSTPPALAPSLNRDEAALIAGCLNLSGPVPGTALEVAGRIDALRR